MHNTYMGIAHFHPAFRFFFVEKFLDPAQVSVSYVCMYGCTMCMYVCMYVCMYEWLYVCGTTSSAGRLLRCVQDLKYMYVCMYVNVSAVAYGSLGLHAKYGSQFYRRIYLGNRRQTRSQYSHRLHHWYVCMYVCMYLRMLKYKLLYIFCAVCMYT